MTKKKKHKSKRKSKKQDNRPILVPPAAIAKLLKLPKPHNTNCPVLYLFYLKKGIQDKTNRIWCQDRYVANSDLKWSFGKVERTKAQLVKLEYIEVERERNKQGHFGKSYIVLRYFPSKFVIEKEEYLKTIDDYVEQFAEWFNILHSEITKRDVKIWELEKQLTCPSKTIGQVKGKQLTYPTKKPVQVKSRLITYNTKVKNTYNRENSIVNKIDDDVCTVKDFFDKDIKIKRQDRFYYRMSVKLYNAAKSIKRITKRANIHNWSGQLKKLHTVDKVSKKIIKKYLLWYTKYIEDEYMPEAFSGKSFREKFDRIVAAKKRRNLKPKKKTSKPYKPSDENDDFNVETKTWIDEKGQKWVEDTIDYEEPYSEEDDFDIKTKEWTDEKGQKYGEDTIDYED